MEHYGIDISKKLESILVDELTRSIDADIMSKILGSKPIKRREKIKNIFNDKIG